MKEVYYIANKYLAQYLWNLPIYIRYRLKIDVTTEDQFLRITFYDDAKYYFGCDVKDYVLSTSENVNHFLYEILAYLNNINLF